MGEVRRFIRNALKVVSLTWQIARKKVAGEELTCMYLWTQHGQPICKRHRCSLYMCRNRNAWGADRAIERWELGLD